MERVPVRGVSFESFILPQNAVIELTIMTMLKAKITIWIMACFLLLFGARATYRHDLPLRLDS